MAAIEDARPDAIVMPISFALSGLIQTIQTKTKIPVYVHTVNDPELAACMMALGAAGLYSDSLGKEDIENLPKSPDDCQMG